LLEITLNRKKMSLLNVRNLSTVFETSGGRTIHAVDNVTFSMAKGEIMGLVGESGCGKSVTALSILKLIPNPPGEIISGEIIFNGVDLLQLSESQMQDIRGRQIGMVFQEPMSSLNPVLKIGTQISEPLTRHLKMNKNLSLSRSLELLEMVGIPDGKQRINDYPHQFSGGQKQRIMIAIALACEPALLIADEATTALDVTVQAQILELLKDLSDNLGISLLIITHNLGIVARYAQRIAVMYAGKIREIGLATDVYRAPKHPYTAGLLDSVPKLKGKKLTRLNSIAGEVPDPTDLPLGCAYNIRCTKVVKKCNTEPGLSVHTTNQSYACWNPL